jgi:hypothetical protein
LPLPFISQGGTAVVFNSIAVGILLNISSQTSVFTKKNPIPESIEPPDELKDINTLEPNQQNNETT